MKHLHINILLIMSFIIFSVILFWVSIFSNYNAQMNGLILIADGLFIILAINYLLYKKDMID